jgi:hypothetical protein
MYNLLYKVGIFRLGLEIKFDEDLSLSAINIVANWNKYSRKII